MNGCCIRYSLVSKVSLCWLFSLYIGCSDQGAVQLVGGENKFEGRVEVCDGGEWKSVCNNMWGNEEAAVVCGQIGFSGELEG